MLYRRCGCRDSDGKQYAVLPERPTAAHKARSCPGMREPNHGTWCYNLALGTDPSGKRLRSRVSGFHTAAEARRALTKATVERDEGIRIHPSHRFLREYLADWLPTKAQTGSGLKPTTVQNYKRYIDHDIAPSNLGRLRLADVQPHHIQAFLGALDRAGRGRTTQRRILAVLQSAFSTAVRQRLLALNPAHGVERPLAERSRFTAWEPAQLGAFLDAADRHRLGPLYDLAAHTGLRRGEIAGLRWSDISWERASILVAFARVQTDREVIETTPKSEAGIRSVDLEDAAVAALRRWRDLQDADRAERGNQYVETGYVFTMPDGQPLSPAHISRLFDRIRQEAGLPKLTFHGLRHEHASLLLAAGADIAIVSKRLGHSSIRVTADVYSHLIADVSREAAQRAAALVPRGHGSSR